MSLDVMSLLRHYHSLLVRTRRSIPEGFFLNTIHIIMAVAADNEYLNVLMRYDSRTEAA